MTAENPSVLSIWAHYDDDLIFGNPAIDAAIGRGEPVTSVFLTGSDAGRGMQYAADREHGLRLAYEHMRGAAGIEIKQPAGGLVSALDPTMRHTHGTWVAWGSGSADRETADESGRVLVPPTSNRTRCDESGSTPPISRATTTGSRTARSGRSVTC